MEHEDWSAVVFHAAREESRKFREALEIIAGAHRGDCPAERDELAVAKEHIAYLRQTAWDVLKATGH